MISVDVLYPYIKVALIYLQFNISHEIKKKMITTTYLAINEWGWLGYEELNNLSRLLNIKGLKYIFALVEFKQTIFFFFFRRVFAKHHTLSF